MKVAKRFIALAHQLHQGRNIYLSELIMGSLYKPLTKGITLMSADPNKPHINYLLASPFWLLQLWLNAISCHRLRLLLTDGQEVAFEQRSIEGRRLVAMTPKNQDLTLDDALKKYLMLFFRCNKFTPNLALLASRLHGPERFTKAFPPVNPTILGESKAI